jgi:diacylglycerol kinase
VPDETTSQTKIDQNGAKAPAGSNWAQLEHILKLDQESRLFGLVRSFKHAVNGVRETLLTERNFKIQVVCAFLALVLAASLKVSLFSWLILIQVIALVLTAELINTALEHMVDLAAGGLYHPIARAAKDAAAGAVLIASGLAVLSALFIFGPYLLPFCQHILRIVQ